MIDVAKISFTKTFVKGYLDGIVIDDEYFFVPLTAADKYAASMRDNEAKGVLHGDGSKYLVSNIEVEI